ncbi:MAG: hypothetical protein C4582_08985 [Desulfobacteraceae bacterium]|jgi:phage gpG-like protein|nr:MAG: hypothetical protein C4582_08985 [Desulfobacteraceae bacterium]
MKVTVHEEDVLRQLGIVARRMENLRPAMSEIGEIIRTSVERNFMVSGRPRWKPSVRAKLQGGQTLSDTGRLRNSITVRASERSVSVGTNVVYAAVHQFGAKKGRFGTIAAAVNGYLRRTASGKKTTVRAHTRRMTLPWGNIPTRTGRSPRVRGKPFNLTC